MASSASAAEYKTYLNKAKEASKGNHESSEAIAVGSLESFVEFMCCTCRCHLAYSELDPSLGLQAGVRSGCGLGKLRFRPKRGPVELLRSQLVKSRQVHMRPFSRGSRVSGPQSLPGD